MPCWTGFNRCLPSERDPRKLIPPLHGALLKSEQEVHLFERLALFSRTEMCGADELPGTACLGPLAAHVCSARHASGEAAVGMPMVEVASKNCSGAFFGGQIP